jgi:tRNA (guanine26-N2/guanine27-N2)-dimethyltransferase
MLEVRRGKAWPSEHYSFVGHCHVHGDTRRVGWRGLGDAVCTCCRGAHGSAGGGGGGRSTPLAVSGPMWTGPLHDRGFVEAMASEAERLGWSGHAVPLDSVHREKSSKNNNQRPLKDLLQLFWDEADPKLPPWYVPIDEIAKRLDRSPSKDELIHALRAEGYAASGCHVDRKALRTDASMGQVAEVARGIGYTPRDCCGGGGSGGSGGGGAGAVGEAAARG